jgi:hypothetical protein
MALLLYGSDPHAFMLDVDKILMKQESQTLALRGLD